MSRPLRLLYENAWYHVMNRGAARNTIFNDIDDYQIFINILLQLYCRYRFEIHAYCLMPNHYHILICTPLPNLSVGMRHLNGLYARYHNRRYKKDGSLFRGRYKAILVDAENYLLRVSRYIHLNPVKACLVKHPGEYPWSSYQFYTKRITLPDWMYIKKILSYFGATQQKNKYALFVIENTDQELETFYRKARLLPVLGTDLFRKQISQTVLAEMIPLRDVPDQKRVDDILNLSNICKIVAQYYQASTKSLLCVDRINGNLPRKVAIYLAAELSSKKFDLIANFFKNISANGISQVVRRIKQLQTNNVSVKHDLSNLIKLLKN